MIGLKKLTKRSFFIAIWIIFSPYYIFSSLAKRIVRGSFYKKVKYLGLSSFIKFFYYVGIALEKILPQKLVIVINSMIFSLRRLLDRFPHFNVIVGGSLFLGAFFFIVGMVHSATFNFTQSSWIGGVDSVSVATHASNQSNWTKYATSTGLTVGSTVQLSPTSYVFTDDGVTSVIPTTTIGGGGFANGTNSSTVVSGSGSGANISLSGTIVPITPPVVSTTTLAVANSQPRGMAFDSSTNSIWVANSGSAINSVTKINASTGIISGTYTVGTAPRSLAFDSSTNSIWVANSGSNNVMKLNASTGALIGTYAVGSLPYGITFDSSTNSVWTANLGDSTVTKLNASTGALIGTYAVGAAGTSPISITFDPSTNSIWTGNNGSINVTKLNASTGALIGTYGGGFGRPQEGGISFDSSTNSVWVGVSNPSGIVKINTTTGVTVGYSVGSGPLGVAFDSATNSIWVANNGSNNVTRLSASTGASVGTYVAGTGPSGVVFDSATNSIWVANLSSNNITKMHVAALSYVASGSFTSATVDLGSKLLSATISYGAGSILPAGTAVNFDVRAGNTAIPDGTWSAWTTGIANGGGASVVAGNRYLQYRVNLSTTDSTVTPTVDQVNISYSQYVSGDLISSVYDSGDANNLVTNMRWTASATSSTEIVKFQIRSSASVVGLASASWCGSSIVCDGTSYFTDSTGASSLPSNHPLRSGGDDRYFQYRVFLSSGGAVTPVLTSSTVQYVVNAPPEFDASYGTNGVTAYQVSTSTDPNFGKVIITYKVRDPDTTTGTANPGYITPSFEYNTGSGWVAIATSSLAVGDLTNKAVNTSSYTLYQATWMATSTIPGIFAPTTQIRVTVNDNEPANNTGQSISSAFALDTKPPTITAVLDASIQKVILTTVDDSQSQYRICGDTTFPSIDSMGNSCTWSTSAGSLSSSSISFIPYKDANGNTIAHIEVKDVLGNTSAQTVIAPSKPGNFDFKDISNVSANAYREFLSWAIFQATSSSAFASYELYHSIDGVTYTLLSSINNPAINYYKHDITTATTSTHFYKVLAKDTDGDISEYTTVLSDVPNGQGSSDTTPPTIAPSSILVPSADLKNTSAHITFTTDELAKADVQYKKSTDNTWTTASSVSYVLVQSVYITGLTPNTLYNLRVRATDVVGNISQYVVGPDFTTVGGPVITGVNAINITDNSVTIFWNTSTSSDSFVYYSNNQNIIPVSSSWSALSVACITSVCQHKIDITRLTPGVKYYYYVKSTDSAGNSSTDDNNGNQYTFSTTYDIFPPTISNISNPVISSTASVISWQTDEPATTQIQWGTASGNLSHTSILDPVKSIYHIVTLSSATNDINGVSQGLTPSTAYFFKVFSSDVAGNTASSTEQKFSTSKDGDVVVVTQYLGGGSGASSALVTPDTTPPVILSATTTDIGAFNASVTLATDKEVSAFIEYGETPTYSDSVGSKEFTTSKVMKLKKLQTGTQYHYRIIVRDHSGNETTSEDKIFTTKFVSELLADRSFLDKATDLQGKIEALLESALPSLSPPHVSVPEVFNIEESSASISWDTNIKTIGHLRYASDEEYIKNTNDYTLDVPAGLDKEIKHNVDLADLKPNTKYHIQAKAYVFPQLEGKTEDITFMTKAAKIKASIAEKKNDGFTIFWSTDEPTTSVVDYKNVKTGEKNRMTDDGKKLYHSVKIEHLPSATAYEVRVSGINEKGNSVESAETLYVMTSADTTSPVITNFKVDNALVPGRNDRIQTVVGWMTDEPANSVVYYEEGAGSIATSSERQLANKIDSLDSYVGNHIIIIPNLKPGSIYRIKVSSSDESGNIRTFGPRTIITPRQTESVLDVIFKNFEDTFKFLRK